MRAAQVKGFGDVDQLEIVQLPDPQPQAGQVRIRVAASGLNYADVMQRAGLYPGGPKPPFISGVEAAGVVEAGEGLPIGARVMVVSAGNCHAETLCVSAASCMPIPDSMSFIEAAAFPVQYLTAYHALTTVGRALAGEAVLIHAAAGGVGTAAVQIAKLLGLHVIGTASAADKRARVLELGADEALSYEEFDQKLSGKNAPTLILEAVGGEVFRRSLAILPSFGRLVVFGAASKEVSPIDTLKLLFRSQGVLGLHLNAIFERPGLMGESVKRLLEWIGQGKLKVQVGHVLRLEQIREAHELISSRKSYGKIVLTPD
ncbi:MAG TPA: NADPH:quinone oxidoreductase family protein [Pyrinomonadaceae bacterium]|jgi:NADPH2:quinone reductase|nr:NADPH:quinone oxidoreductase family protein [Pyrinomonadaceae bacterium]